MTHSTSGAPAAPDSGTGQVTLTVVDKVVEAEGVCRLRLADPHGRRVPDWAPGAHIDLGLANGTTRQYSLCGDRWDPSAYDIAVLREPTGRGGSAYVHDVLAEGEAVEVGGPRNHFRLVPAEHYLFIAGGIGITPLLPMLEQAAMLGTSWTLLYGGRSRSSMAFLDRLSPWGDQVLVRPQDTHGLLDIATVLAAQPAGVKVYCCGPAPLLAAVEAACADLPPGHLRTERFSAAAQGPPARTTGYRLELARSGRVLQIAPGTNVLDALGEAGVPVLASCRQGVCGTCETSVLAGVPDHRDSLLDDDERRQGRSFFPCVSRSVSDRLVIDL